MGREVNSTETSYIISDLNDRIKREIIDAHADDADSGFGLPKDIRDRVMVEVNHCGLPVKVVDDTSRTSITIFFPILYDRGGWLEEYLVEGYFVKSIEFYDYGRDGKIDDLSDYKRKEFRNLIEATEDVLKEHNKNSK